VSNASVVGVIESAPILISWCPDARVGVRNWVHRVGTSSAPLTVTVVSASRLPSLATRCTAKVNAAPTNTGAIEAPSSEL